MSNILCFLCLLFAYNGINNTKQSEANDDGFAPPRRSEGPQSATTWILLPMASDHTDLTSRKLRTREIHVCRLFYSSEINDQDAPNIYIYVGLCFRGHGVYEYLSVCSASGRPQYRSR